jgi:hypothetical protein
MEQLGRIEHFASLERAAASKPEAAKRADSFMLIDEGLSEKSAQYEAKRCLACNLRLLMERTTLPPREEGAQELTAETVANVPETEGVYQLLDEDKQVLAIKGVMNLKSALLEVLDEDDKARYFVYEEEMMYTKRESELIQQYLHEHGELPGGGDDELDELF